MRNLTLLRWAALAVFLRSPSMMAHTQVPLDFDRPLLEWEAPGVPPLFETMSWKSPPTMVILATVLPSGRVHNAVIVEGYLSDADLGIDRLRAEIRQYTETAKRWTFEKADGVSVVRITFRFLPVDASELTGPELASTEHLTVEIPFRAFVPHSSHHSKNR